MPDDRCDLPILMERGGRDGESEVGNEDEEKEHDSRHNAAHDAEAEEDDQKERNEDEGKRPREGQHG